MDYDLSVAVEIAQQKSGAQNWFLRFHRFLSATMKKLSAQQRIIGAHLQENNMQLFKYILK